MTRLIQSIPGFEASEVQLHVVSGSGKLDLDLIDDPVTSISVHRSCPEDLLPVVDALSAMGPFAILSTYGGGFIDPGELRP
jgi:hypothetical protein